MTTWYQDKQNTAAYNVQISQSKDQFNNLNLNQNQSFFKNESTKSFSTSSSNTFKTHHQQQINFDGKKDSNFMNQKDEWSKKEFGINHYTTNSNNDKENRKLSSSLYKTKETNNSTLSLYIAAYEANIAEAASAKKEQELKDDEEEATVKPKKKMFGGKPWRSAKGIITNGSLKYPFEIPRGNDNDDDKKSAAAAAPEVMQFKASQKLINPNSSSSKPPPPKSRPFVKRTPSDGSSSTDSDKTDFSAKSADTISPTKDSKEEDTQKKSIEVRVPYTMPGVLHFLQHEWSKIELERTRWDMERAELKARISFLQGERKGQENLKRDLVRRIKMLEYSLKQERLKIYRLTHNGEDPTENLEDDDKPALTSNVPLDIGAVINTKEAPIWQRARASLKQFMDELGYSEEVVSPHHFGMERSYSSSCKDSSKELDSSEQYSKSSDSDVLNQAFYGKEDEDLVSSLEAAAKKAAPLSANENDANNDQDDESVSNDELDDALEALNQLSCFLGSNDDERDETEIDENEEYRLSSSSDEDDDDERNDGSPEATELETDLLVSTLIAVLSSPSSSNGTTAAAATTAAFPSSDQDDGDDEEEEEDDIKNNTFLGDESET